MAVIETWYKQDLQKPVQVRYLDGSLFTNNGNGNRIGVEVTNNGEAVALSGTVSGYVVLSDGTTVPCTGSRSGNKASILIPPAAYQQGNVFISIFLTDGTTVTTLCAVSTSVLLARTDNQVSPGSVVTDWTNTINAAMQEVETAAENLGHIVATPYASLTFPVPLGKYTYYNNNVYRCIVPIPSSESFTAAHWSSAINLGDELSSLKNAFKFVIIDRDNGMDTFYPYSNFDHHGLMPDGTFAPTQNYRVSCTEKISFDRSITVKVKSGFKWGYIPFVNGTPGSWSEWKTTDYTISAGTIFVVQIARITENTSEVADVAEFVSALTFRTNTDIRLQNVEENITDVKDALNFNYEGLETFLTHGSFAIGGLASDGTLTPWQKTRVSSANLDKLSFDRDIVVKVKSGFVWGYIPFSGDTPGTWVDWTSAPRKITAGTKFVVQIRKNPEGTSVADVNEYVSALTFSSDISEKTDKNAKDISDITNLLSVKPGYINYSFVVSSPTDTEVVTDYIAVNAGDRFHIYYTDKTIQNAWLVIATYDSSKNGITRGEARTSTDDFYYIIPSGVSYFRVCYKCHGNQELVKIKNNKNEFLNNPLPYLITNSGFIAANGGIDGSVDQTYKQVYTSFYPIREGDVYNFSFPGTGGLQWVAIGTYTEKDYSSGFIARRVILQSNVNDYSVEIRLTDSEISSGAKYFALTYTSYGKPEEGVVGVNSNQLWYELQGVPTALRSIVNPNVKSIGHRGFYTAPENTLISFKTARQFGFNRIETDVQMTSDGVAVLLHDDTINRTARNSDGSTIEGDVYLKDITYNEALQYDFGIYKGEEFKGTKIPTLAEMAALCRRIGLHPYIEIKENRVYTEEEILSYVDIINSNGMTGKVSWVSFNNGYLSFIKNHDETAEIVYAAGAITSTVVANAVALKTGKNKVIIAATPQSDTDIELCKTAGIELYVDQDAISGILNLSNYVTGVFSNTQIAGFVLYQFGR